MILKFLVLATSIVFSWTSTAQISALREKSETWEEAAARNMGTIITPFYNSGNAYSVSGSFFDLDSSDIQEEADLIEIETAFYLVRDMRFLKSRKDQNFLRRITWLFPDDGCYARAALMKGLLDDVAVPVSRVFIFGDLEVITDNHPAGAVNWWYHTAPVMKATDGTLYVLDPAVEPARPLTLEEWTLRQVPALDQAQLSICSGNTYAPNNSCTSTFDPLTMAMTDTLYLLDFEWNRQSLLKRDPKDVLGDTPPWSEEEDAVLDEAL